MRPAAMATMLDEAAVERRRPDGVPYRSLTTAAVLRIARRLDTPLRCVEQTALGRGIVPERYARNMTSIGPEEQQRLLDATVCVVGVGGLGGSVADMLARVGIGRLRLVDDDAFEESNLNRQRFADAESLGRPKALLARDRLVAVNPAVEVVALTDRLTLENGAAILGPAEIAVDCLDSLPARTALQAACRQKRIPMVSAAVAGLSGQLTVIFPEDVGLAALYGDLATAPERGAETTLGNLPHAVTLLAGLECSETVKVLLGKPRTLRNRLLVFDLNDPVFDIVELA